MSVEFVAEQASGDMASAPGFLRGVGYERHDKRARRTAASQSTKSAASGGHGDVVLQSHIIS